MEPFVQYIVPAILGVTAIILLVTGGRLLKPALGLSGFLVGVGAGFLIAPSISLQMSPLIIAGITGTICALMCVFIAKFAIIVVLGASCAILTPYLTWQIVGLGEGKDANQIANEVFDPVMTTQESSQEEISQSKALPFSAEKVVSEAFTSLWKEATVTISDGVDRGKAGWNVIPGGARAILVGSAIAGLLLGLLIATFMPFTASAIVTASGGSSLLLITVRNVVTREWTPNPFTNLSPTEFATSIVVVAITGFILQMTFFKRPPVAKPKKK